MYLSTIQRILVCLCDIYNHFLVLLHYALTFLISLYGIVASILKSILCSSIFNGRQYTDLNYFRSKYTAGKVRIQNH